jgi:AbrB family looped-hinge helix DNA binding protein
MSKVTSRYQVTVPKAIADLYGIRPGDNLEWIPAGDVIRVVTGHEKPASKDVEERLRLFDEPTERRGGKTPADRGWSREDLYGRGRSR